MSISNFKPQALLGTSRQIIASFQKIALRTMKNYSFAGLLNELLSEHM